MNYRKNFPGVLLLVLSMASLFPACSGDSNDSNKDGVMLVMLSEVAKSLEPVTSATITGPENQEGAVEGTAPYFQSITITKETLSDTNTYDQVTLSDVNVLDSSGNITRTATFKGVLLKDILINGAKFRPDDKGDDGRASVVVVRGDTTSVFSFWELIKTPVGLSVIVAYQMNGESLGSLGDLAIVSGGDVRNGSRFVSRLKGIEAINEWVNQTTGSQTSSFALSGDVTTPITVDTSSVSGLTHYKFYDVGPSFKNTYWQGNGVLLSDVIDQAVLKYPYEKNRCYVLLEASDKYRNTFSCGEIYFTSNGIGEATASSTSDNDRSRGILVVTDSFQKASGTSNCTVYANCHVDGTATWSDNSTDFMTIVSTEDKQPFSWPESTSTATINFGGRHISWLTGATIKYVE